jgi:hypothetical protein
MSVRRSGEVQVGSTLGPDVVLAAMETNPTFMGIGPYDIRKCQEGR